MSGAQTIAVIDRHISLGAHSGPVCLEVRSALFAMPERPQVFGFVLGLGGRDVTVDDFVEVVRQAEEAARVPEADTAYTLIGVREI